MDSPLIQFREEPGDFLPADQRFSAHDRQVERPVPIDQGKDAVNQLRPLEFALVCERPRRSKAIRPICIAAGAGEGALPRDLNGH